LILGISFDKARLRTRIACIVGYTLTMLSFVTATSYIFLPVAEESAAQRLNLVLYIGLVCEVGVVGFLSYGMMKRKPKWATVLFVYFAISRLFWISTGLVGFYEVASIVRFFSLHVLPAYAFYEGMRGAWAYTHLTTNYDPAQT
jgi:hypothetical protein